MKIRITPKIIAIALLSQNCSLEKAPSTSIRFVDASIDYTGGGDNEAEEPTSTPTPSKPPVGGKEVFLAKIKYSSVLKAIEGDILKASPSEQIKLRYFTLHVPSNAGEGSKTLDSQREAFVKTINSLSTKSSLVKPEAIDSNKTIYRLNLDDINMAAETFDTIMAEHYPFHDSFGDLGDIESITNQQADTSIKNLIKTNIYAIRMDWFNATATLPILYAKFLQHSDNLSDFEAKVLGNRVPLSVLHAQNAAQTEKVSRALVKEENGVASVDRRIANILLNQVTRTGFDNSGAALGNRLIERHPTAKGSYYITYDFLALKPGDALTDTRGQEALAGADDILARTLTKAPLGPLGTNGSQLEFQHDGDEVLYTLPNGLFAFFVADAQGRRLDKENIRLIKEFTGGPPELAQAVTNGFSCMSCHNAGILSQADTVVDGIKRNKGSLAAEDLARINKIYNLAEMKQAVDEDNRRFFKAMIELGLDPKGKDPVDKAFSFYNRALTKKAVMAELDLSDADFARLLADPQFNGIFNPLNNAQGFINRGVFQAIYPSVVARFKPQVNHIAPTEADFVVNLDCMIKDVLFMDQCVINPVVLNLQAFR